MKAKSQFGEIEIGQPIVVSYGNGVELGWFKGLGQGTYQYYSVNNVLASKKRNNKIYTSFIHGNNKRWRIAPFNITSITDQEAKEEALEAIEYLNEKNFPARF